MRWDEVIGSWRELSDDSDSGIERCLARPCSLDWKQSRLVGSCMDPVVSDGTDLAYEVWTERTGLTAYSMCCKCIC